MQYAYGSIDRNKTKLEKDATLVIVMPWLQISEL
jgi:hypothetical protein